MSSVLCLLSVVISTPNTYPCLVRFFLNITHDEFVRTLTYYDIVISFTILSGAPTQGQGTTSVPVSSPPIFATSTSLVPGDRVRVQLEVEIVKMMQEGHGGWNDQMKEVRRNG